MHLIWENLIPNLIDFWIGTFKGLDHAGKDYVIKQHVWEEVGASIAACGTTIPLAFGALVPNIATKQYIMSAETYTNWLLSFLSFV